MLSCKEATRLLSEALDRRLLLSERIALGFHLFICKMCRRYARQVRMLTDVLRSSIARDSGNPDARLDAAARARIRESLKNR
jgi:hypothetical protein